MFEQPIAVEDPSLPSPDRDDRPLLSPADLRSRQKVNLKEGTDFGTRASNFVCKKLHLTGLKPLPKRRHHETHLPADDGEADENEFDAAPPSLKLSKQSVEQTDISKPVISLNISKALDIPREKTETELRAEKLKKFEKECTRIEDFLFVSGVAVAQNLELLKGVGITHIVNCAGLSSENFFPESFQYTTLYLNDAASEDIACHIYRSVGGKILVHCHQGVSRSCAFCIAFLIQNYSLSYEDAFLRVKEKRGICNPNAGFAAQLMTWRRKGRSSYASLSCALLLQDHSEMRERGEVPEGGAKITDMKDCLASKLLGQWDGKNQETSSQEDFDEDHLYVLQRDQVEQAAAQILRFASSS
eukprot:764231-Hanusia_phi.AAC.5